MYTTLISSEQLLAERTPSWVILDCRFQLDDAEFGEKSYRTGHIPGAHYVNLEYNLSGVKNGSNGRHPLPDRQRLAVDLGAMGIGPDTQVVTYDDNATMFAARAWWVLRWMGHQRVALLDGGLTDYLKQGGVLDTAVAARHTRRFVMHPAHAATVSTTQLLENLDSKTSLVVDARAPERYRGQGETLDPAAGHIPGAVNRFFRDNLQADGRFKPTTQLQQEWRTLLGESLEPSQLVHQCGSGVSACINLLALEHAGLGGSRLYPGSWSEWSADPARPIATDN